VTALLKIARHFLASRIGPWLVVAAFLTSAGAFFLHMFYSEAVFIALAFWAYLFALRRQWVRMGLCLTLLTASHITAVLFIGLCFLEFWRSKQWRLRGLLSWHVLWFPASVLGFAAYALYLYAVTGDALAMFKAYHVAKDWSYQVFDPNVASTLAHEVSVVWNAAVGGRAFDNLIFIDHLLPLASLVLLLASSVYVLGVLRGRGVPLGVFGLLSFVMFTLNSNVVSGHRHVLPCVVLYIALVLMSERRAILRAVTYGVMYGGALFQGVLVVMFVSGTWAG
jgi:hypothetical protein